MNFARTAAAGACFTILAAACATAKPIATTAETNLRQAPGTSSTVVTLIPKGTTIEVGACTKGWCKATWNGQDGYVIARNVGLAAAPRPRRRHVRTAAGYEDDYNVPVVYGPPPYAGPPPVYYGNVYGPGWGWGRW